MIVFETERLLVRYLCDDDFEAFSALCSDLEINRYMGDGQPLTTEQTRAWIQISQENYQKYDNGCFAIISRQHGQLIGFGGIARRSNTPQVEIIYAFKPSCWGQGLASEFVSSLLDTCFERWHFSRIEASIDSRNSGSIRVVEKAGMVYVRSEVDENHQRILWYALDRPVPFPH